MSMNLSNIAILNIHRIDSNCFISGFSKTKGINLLQNNDFTVKNAAHQSEKREEEQEGPPSLKSVTHIVH